MQYQMRTLYHSAIILQMLSRSCELIFTADLVALLCRIILQTFGA